MDAELRAGWARADISPPLGIHMGGYWGRSSGATAILDRLEAKALVVSDKDSSVVLLVLDIVALAAADVQIIRDRITAATGISPQAVMVCCTHTHAGPLTLAFRGMGEMDCAYMGSLRDAAVQAASAAAGTQEPATLRYVQTPVQIGHNRPDPRGPVSTVLQAFEVVTERAAAVVFSHACHPVVLGPSNHGISAEFPGAAVRRLEADGVSFAMFVNGACADVNPRLAQGEAEQVTELGHELADAVLVAIDTEGVRICAGGLAHRRKIVSLPLIHSPPRAHLIAEILALKGRAMVKRLVGGGNYWDQLVPQAQRQWAKEALNQTGAHERTTTPFEIQTLRIGSLVLLGMEGEIFVRYQLDHEGTSVLQPTILCGFANGCIGYVPTADEYVRGGYEVDVAYKVYPSTRMIAPESEGIIRRTIAEMISSLQRDEERESP